MKTLLFAPFLSIALLACRKEAGSNRTFDLLYKAPTTVALGGAGSALATLTVVNDSRCPTDVVCIWGGAADATVTLTDDVTTQTIRLRLGADSAAVTINKQAYWLRLLAVNPYPSLASASLPKTATLRLRPN